MYYKIPLDWFNEILLEGETWNLDYFLESLISVYRLFI
jgi:hypothetical protein